MDIFSGIIGTIFVVVGLSMLCWLAVYSVKNETEKRNKELESELKQLKIVNSNLAKYNDVLSKLLKK